VPDHDHRLQTRLPRGVVLRDPLLLASGCCGYGEDYAAIADPCKFGGVITKAVSLEARLGNSGVRLRETPAGLLNCIGLQNPGIESLTSEVLPRLIEAGFGFIVNVVGNTSLDFAQLVRVVDDWHSNSGLSGREWEGSGLLGYELDLSCPNVEKGTQFATDEPLLRETVQLCRAETGRLLIAKLSPNVTDIRSFAAASQESGADAVTISNTLSGISIDVRSRRSHLGRPSAGLSGAAIRPAVLYHVWRCHKALPELPIIASGGIMDTDSALQFMLAGATALQLGTGLFVNPALPIEIQSGLSAYLDSVSEESLVEIVGKFDDSVRA
jgi:dihydroorotate dehydrogenase (NAD+) catalytic subunit